MTKLTKEDSQKLSDFQELYAELATDVAKNFMLKLEAEVTEEELKERARQLIILQSDLHDEMTEKYGPGFLELETED